MLPVDSLFVGGTLDEGLELFIQLYHHVSAYVKGEHTGLLDWSAKAACLSSEFVRFFCKPCTLSLTPEGREWVGHTL
jgi:hypothetical protein